MGASSSLTFADLLRRFRLAAGLTQEELAERASMSARGVSDLERGLKTRPHRYTVESIAAALDLSPEDRDLFRGSVASKRRGPKPDQIAAPLTTLPAEPTPLVGRERDQARALSLLRSPHARLLTLTGAGGVGKTRLALRLASIAREEFDDGVVYVPLEAIRDASLVAASIVGALDLGEGGSRKPEEALLAHLKRKQCLLFLDNFEQVLPAGVLVSQLLATCPGVKVVATSRAALRLRGEHELEVQPLDVPDPVSTLSARDVHEYSAVALLLDRIQDVRPDFALTDETARVLAEICRRLDGLPLALELAAARARVLSVRALLERLDCRLQLLTRGARDLPQRQQTMRDTIAWSFDLLSPEEKALFGALAVFVGGGDLEAIEAVCGPAGQGSVLEGLTSLVENSLLRRREVPAGAPRFAMLETVREFAAECLTANGETNLLRSRHAEYYLNLAEDAERRLTGADQMFWLERLEREHDNLRAVLDWSRDSGHTETELRLVGALWRLWSMRGHLTEGRRRVQEALGRVTVSSDASAQAKASVGAAMLAIEQGAYDEAGSLCCQALELAREGGEAANLVTALNAHGTLARQQGRWGDAIVSFKEALQVSHDLRDRHSEATALVGLAVATELSGDAGSAEALFEQSTTIFRELRDTRGLAAILQNRALRAGQAGEFQRGEALEEEALPLLRALGDSGRTAEALYTLGSFAALQGQYERAVTLHEQSLALRVTRGDERNAAASRAALGLVALNVGDERRARELLEEAVAATRALNDPWGQAVALMLLGHVELATDHVDRAKTLFGESAQLFQTIGNPFYMVWCLEGMAGTAAAQGQSRLAARLCGARDALRARLGLHVPPAHPAGYARVLAAIRDSLGEELFEQAHEIGLRHPIEQTVSEGLERT